ncbi:MAG: alanine--tRNA ligase [Nitrospinae bacterium RIFCSPLOWO2_01_FULL_39_10]|nr:MAG: alanine--tRNA ligase [Nitrospinae bacterium RIFCSPLOWO2_01_FULL_39_10]
MTGNEIRKKFLDYFKERGHTIVKSSSLIPSADPTLLFTNAGMVQFKDVFLGKEKRDYKRAVSSQKCVRAGGKHNDLEVVGRTARHHTFFEMLGNFSFGDYFKEGAIEYGWEFMTEVVKLPKEKLWITVYKDDDEAFKIWNEKIGIPANKIVRLGEKDNFWSMGDTGPCGPCSEIHIDQGEGIGCGRPECNVECDCDRFMEVWNLVFMQYNRDAKGVLTPLPNPSIDTGMGLERLSAVAQKVKSNYDSDLLRPIITYTEGLFEKEYGKDSNMDISFRVIADHSRSMTFLIGDGVMPSNEGRGYVLRRIIRRASRHGRMLGKSEPFLFKTSDVVIDLMKDTYPELLDRREYISKVISTEEERFSNTLDFGMKMLNDMVESLKAKRERLIAGEDAFKLYDTYGFPLDLTEDIARDSGLAVDSAGFNKAMEVQKERARASWKGSGEEGIKSIYRDIAHKIKGTQSLSKPQRDMFIGYDTLESEGTVLSLIKGNDMVKSASEGEQVEIVFDKTPFYGESGGQVGDTGKIWNDDVHIDVTDTKKPLQNLIIHNCIVKKGNIKVGDVITISVSNEKRRATALNHSATHLLHTALRDVLGDHVKQAGSLVAPDRLRFDYTHFSAPNIKELHRVEEIVNQKIRENYPVETSVTGLEEAIKKGATALFGEKYGEEVRIVKMGDYSMELCGGTHVRATGDIGLFKIVHEGSVASGIRRIEALTGEGAYKYVRQEEDNLLEIREVLKSPPQEEMTKLKKIMDRNKELERELQKQKEKITKDMSGDTVSEIKDIKGINVISKNLGNFDIKDLRTFVDSTKVRIKSGVVVVGAVTDGKVSLVAGVTKDLISKLNAGEIIKQTAVIVDGSGGGRADMAQAGGKNPAKLSEALEKVYEIVEKMLQ